MSQRDSFSVVEAKGCILLIFVYYLYSIITYLSVREGGRDGHGGPFRHGIIVILYKNEVQITVESMIDFGYNKKKRGEIKKS